MRGPAPIAFVIALVAIAGCTMISGAADFAVVDDAGAADVSAPSDVGPTTPASGLDGAVPADPRDGSADVVDVPPTDAGSDAPPVIVRCNNTDCAGQCCISPAGSGQCVAHGESCAAERIVLSCDEKADCPSGQSCCLIFAGPSPHTVCSSSCPPGVATLCATDGDCTGLDDCIPLADSIGLPPMHGNGACE